MSVHTERPPSPEAWLTRYQAEALLILAAVAR